MRLIKMFGLATVAAMAAMAFVGATSASANGNTALCNTHEGLTCGANIATSVSMIDIGWGTLLTTLVDVICDEINATGTPLALGNPQSVHISGLDFESCETSDGDPCWVSVLKQPLANLLKKGLDTGTLTGTNGETLVECEDVVWELLDIHCVYDSTGLTFAVGAQHLTADDTQIDKIGGTLCPDESFLDGLLTTNVGPDAADNRYVLA